MRKAVALFMFFLTPALAAQRAGEVFRDCPECPEMVVVPAGTFMMGSDPHYWPDSRPQHKVTIAQPFAVGRFDVTFAEWDACVAAGSCKARIDVNYDFGWGRGRRPVIMVTWTDAKDYVAWLAQKTGKPYRLLSEAEWEYAARAGTTTKYAFGDTYAGVETQAKCCASGNWNARGTVEVGSFKPNAFGLYDMYGNVQQWVEDCYNQFYDGAPTDGSAWDCSDVPPSASNAYIQVIHKRVIRGTSWFYNAVTFLPDWRNENEPSYRSNDLGFRVARALEP